jgi:methyl-accepting chemotaxis protein
MSLKKISISSKVLLIMCAGLLLSLLITVPFLTVKLSDIKNMTLQQESDLFRSKIRESMEAKKKVWLTNALQIAENPIVKKAILQNDRQGIIDVLAHYGQVFKEKTGFKNVKVHIIDKDLHSLVKSWDPENFGEALDYSLAYKQAKQAGDSLVTMEASPKGLRLKGLFPVMHDTEFQGIVNFEGGLNSIKRSLKPAGIDFLYLLDNEYLKIAKGIRGKQKIGRYTLSQKDVDEEFLKHSAEALDIQKALDGYSLDSEYLTVAAPVEDVSGKAIGVFLIGRKTDRVMATVNKSKRMMWSLFLLMASTFVAMILVVAFFLNRYMVRPISRIVDGLNEGADQVASASSQVSASSQSLAEGASEQAASIEETSSSLEEISSMTRQNADHADQANSLMKEAKHVVGSANASMNEMVSSMQEITKASEETSKIIKTIDEIAFQTNLLALNAAVEAARAGEAGAGFAVVADEVRNLALRAAEAAKNTAELIEDTTKKVQDGSTLVEKTSDEFDKVEKSAMKVAELVGEIAAASKEQSDGVDQVNVAVADMDKVVQQNSANAEESASSSEEMNAQAKQMKYIVDDLVALVGGSSVQRHDDGRSGFVLGRRRAGKALPRSGSAHHPNAEMKPATQTSKQSGREVNPEKVIPFDKEESFEDF